LTLGFFRKIIDYLENRWTKREIKKFVRLLDIQLELIRYNPTLYAETGKIKREIMRLQPWAVYILNNIETIVIYLIFVVNIM